MSEVGGSDGETNARCRSVPSRAQRGRLYINRAGPCYLWDTLSHHFLESLPCRVHIRGSKSFTRLMYIANTMLLWIP